MKESISRVAGVFGVLGLVGCGAVSDSATLVGGASGAFEGKWTGQGNCEAVQESDGERSTDSAQTPFEFEFDSNGSLVMELGGERRTLDSEGETFNFMDPSGLITSVTVTKRSVSDGVVEYVIDSVADQTQADSTSNFSVHSVQQTSLKLTKSAVSGRASLTFVSSSEDTNSFSSEFGSSLTRKVTEVSCSGELELE